MGRGGKVLLQVFRVSMIALLGFQTPQAICGRQACAVVFMGGISGLKLLGLNPSFATYQLCDLSRTIETLQASSHLTSKVGSYNSMCYKHTHTINSAYTHTHFYTNTHIYTHTHIFTFEK